MNIHTFGLVANAIRSNGRVRDAACLVLTEQMRVTDAAALTGCSVSSVSNSVSRYRIFLAICQEIAALENSFSDKQGSLRGPGSE